jgi:hypothetical protein
LWNFWWSNNWGTYTIGFWADYGYKITKFENLTNKYYWRINYYFLYFDFSEDWCTYAVALYFNCRGSVTCPGLPEIKLSYVGDASSLGTNPNSWTLTSGFDIVGATIYKRTNSPLFESYDPAGGF